MPRAKPRFRPYNLDQNAMVVINYQDQLQPGTCRHTFEHAVHYLIEHKLDLASNGNSMKSSITLIPA